MAYKKVMTDRTPSSWKKYFSDFPNGRHLEDVKYVQVDVCRNIVVVRDFLIDYPTGEYSILISALKDSLWDLEITKYEKKLSIQEGNKDALIFFNSLLEHMKDKNLSDISVKFTKSLDLKNYEDYNQNVIHFCDSLYGNIDGIVTGHILPLTSNFEEGNINTLESIVVEGISKSFNNVFNEGFINVKGYNKNDSANANALFINIDYLIKNESLFEDYDVPNIWTYTENKIFQTYLLGIGIEFKFTFQIPDTEVKYEFAKIAEPSGEINDIEDIRDGYQRMTQITFANYANTISENFGIQGVYFQPDTANQSSL